MFVACMQIKLILLVYATRRYRQVGVERSRKALSQADLILFVLNEFEALTQEDYTLYGVRLKMKM